MPVVGVILSLVDFVNVKGVVLRCSMQVWRHISLCTFTKVLRLTA